MSYDGQSFPPDIPGAQVIPAHKDNVIRGVNNPKVLVIHTPEEPADDFESTPVYFKSPRGASTHYYQDNDGDLIQMVPEKYCPIANGVTPGNPYPLDTDPAVSLNRQSLNIEVEGYAAGMSRTCRPGSVQWGALRNWIISCCLRKGIEIDRNHVIGHYEVASNRSDPGTLDLDKLVREARHLARNLRDAEAHVRAEARIRAALTPNWRAAEYEKMHQQFHYLGIPSG